MTHDTRPVAFGRARGASRPRTRRTVVGLLVCLPLLLAACATPVGVVRVSPEVAYRELTTDVLTTGELSIPTRNVLQERGLARLFEAEPEAALRRLHEVVISRIGGGREIFALGELSFLHARRSGSREHYLASVIYAYAFLFPEDAAEVPDRFDARIRKAADLYNFALAAAYTVADGTEVLLADGVRRVPWGEVEVAFDRASLSWRGRQLERLVAIAEFDVRGLRARYRGYGIGSPLAANLKPPPPGTPEAAEAARDMVSPELKFPMTALLRLDQPRRQLGAARFRATLELYSGLDVDAVTIGDQTVPLEIEPTVTLAYTLGESRVWDTEISGFFRAIATAGEGARLGATRPHQRGRVPVVFVHGTVSSPGRWAEMLNRLDADPIIRERCDFWFFTYDTGNPVTYSAMLLRRALTQAVQRLDPERTDPGLKRMVVIGHSQGGLLTKMTAIDSGSRLWDAVSPVPIDELRMSDETRRLLREALFIEPLPFVERVAFISTPHRGAYVTLNTLVGWITRFIKLPFTVLGGLADITRLNPELGPRLGVGRVPTSVDQMRPGNRFIQGLAAIPVAPGIAANSIIPVRGDGPPEKGNDGVVAYTSAHIDGVESELVVRWGHSVQDHPEAIEEVRRILLLHLNPE